MVMPHEQALCAVVDLLTRLQIPYMICGSVASSQYGEPRSTHDVDLVIDPTAQQLAALVKDVGPGFYVSETAAREAFQRKSMFNLVDFNSGIKVDLIVLGADAFSIEEFGRKQNTIIGGRQFTMVSVEDSILSKLAWNKITPSERQLRDVRQMILVQGDALDGDYLRKWAKVLDVNEQLEAMLG